MELKDVILGFMDWKQLTGYELKSLFSELDYLPWSGNNNQIYTALLELEKEGLVKKQTILQQKLPAQKRYRATAGGRGRLREAVLKEPKSKQVKEDVQMAAGSIHRTAASRDILLDFYDGMTA